ncbi:MAG: Crp/Fnr family transcriptional regulator [Candidatus Omnitrophica bacterium]|nr:Crp/Fnr family transcriptional regulator [Candidatus Omnitrophota bacterium]
MNTQATNSDKLWYLKRINLFKAMNQDDMMNLAQKVIEKNFRKKELIYLSNQPGEFVYLLKKGVVKISKLTSDGRELTLALLKPGEIFGELEVLGAGEAGTQAEAHSDVMICILRRNDLMGLLQMKPDLGISLSKLIGFRRRIIENRMENLIFRNIPQRLAFLFLELKKEFGRNEGDTIKIDIPLTHEDIANLIGSARATVTDVLNDFKNKDMIQTAGKYFFLKGTKPFEELTK